MTVVFKFQQFRSGASKNVVQVLLEVPFLSNIMSTSLCSIRQISLITQKGFTHLLRSGPPAACLLHHHAYMRRSSFSSIKTDDIIDHDRTTDDLIDHEQPHQLQVHICKLVLIFRIASKVSNGIKNLPLIHWTHRLWINGTFIRLSYIWCCIWVIAAELKPIMDSWNIIDSFANQTRKSHIHSSVRAELFIYSSTVNLLPNQINILNAWLDRL